MEVKMNNAMSEDIESKPYPSILIPAVNKHKDDCKIETHACSPFKQHDSDLSLKRSSLKKRELKNNKPKLRKKGNETNLTPKDQLKSTAKGILRLFTSKTMPPIGEIQESQKIKYNKISLENNTSSTELTEHLKLPETPKFTEASEVIQLSVGLEDLSKRKYTKEIIPDSICASLNKSYEKEIENDVTGLVEQPKRISLLPLASKSFLTKSSLKCSKVINTNNIKSFLRMTKKNRNKLFHCPECDKHFSRKYSLSFHLHVHTKGKNYECTRCKKTFKHVKYLRRHMKETVKCNKPLKCIVCDKRFTTSSELNGHFKVHYHGESPKSTSQSQNYSCLVCEKIFSSRLTLKRHVISSHTNGKLYRCTIPKCQAKFFDQWRLEKHLQTDHSKLCKTTNAETRFKCSVCDRMLFKKNMKKHLERHNNEKKVFKCDKCGKVLKRAFDLQEHEVVHHSDEKQWLCSHCGKDFKTKRYLRKHMLLHTGVRFPCCFCGFSFSTYPNLKRHIPLHTKEKQYQCEICGNIYYQFHSYWAHKKTVHKNPNQLPSERRKQRKFRSNQTEEIVTKPKKNRKPRSDIGVPKVRSVTCKICNVAWSALEISRNEHMKMHREQGEYEFKCSYCFKTFTTKTTLSYHINIHTGEKPFKCSVCGHEFNSYSNLKRHEVVHSDVKPFKCLVCLKSFRQRSVLTTHMRIHTGEKPYQCKMCARRFSDQSTYHKHKKIHGNGDKENKLHEITQNSNCLEKVCQPSCTSKSQLANNMEIVQNQHPVEYPFAVHEVIKESMIVIISDSEAACENNQNLKTYLPIVSDFGRALPKKDQSEGSKNETETPLCIDIKDYYQSYGSEICDNQIGTVDGEYADDNFQSGESNDIVNMDDPNNGIGKSVNQYTKNYCAHADMDDPDDNIVTIVDQRIKDNCAKVDMDDPDEDGTCAFSCTEHNFTLRDKNIDVDSGASINIKNDSTELEMSTENKDQIESDHVLNGNSSTFTTFENIPKESRIHLFGKVEIEDHTATLTTNIHNQNGMLIESYRPFLRKKHLKQVKVPATRFHKIIISSKFVKLHCCSKCNRHFLKRKSLITHQLAHKKVRRFECFKCKEPFKMLKHVKRHLREIIKCKKPYKCIVCEIRFESNSVLENHLKTHFGKSFKMIAVPSVGFRCIVCFKSYQNQTLLRKHVIKAHTNKRMYNCTECRASFFTLKTLNQHVEKRHTKVVGADEPKLHECSVCSKAYLNKRSLQEHIQIHHSDEMVEKKFKCNLCDKAYFKPFSLKAHKLSVHSDERPWICQFCGKGFKIKRRMLVHMKCHSGIRYQCPHCDVTFSNPSNLTRHLPLHTKDKQYICEVCGKIYYQIHSLSMHIKTVHEDRDNVRFMNDRRPGSSSSFDKQNTNNRLRSDISVRKTRSTKCKICNVPWSLLESNKKTHMKMHRSQGEFEFQCHTCFKSFTTKNSLNYHINSHTGEKPYKCSQCGRGFSSYANLKRHEQIHSEVKAFNCTVCHKSFKQKAVLINHMRIHTGEKPFGCTVCERKFSDPSTLYKHRKTHFKEVTVSVNIQPPLYY